jgi:phage major head subunit gpT-like protein
MQKNPPQRRREKQPSKIEKQDQKTRNDSLYPFARESRLIVGSDQWQMFAGKSKARRELA